MELQASHGGETEAEEFVQVSSSTRANCCHQFLLKIRGNYRARRFKSKAAALILIWNMLGNAIFGSLDSLLKLFNLEEEAVPNVVPFIMLIISSLVSGWLADKYLGHYRMTKIGMVVLFTASVLQSILVVSLRLAGDSVPTGLSVALVTTVSSLGYGGGGILLVTLPQLGFEQMPNASTTNITSFITWYVGSFFVGVWISDFSINIGVPCSSEEFATVWSLFPVICMAAVLISEIYLTPKWLTIPRKTPQTIKTMIGVLRFAKQHKVPVNRSAFTYWEERIPPRIDLGKNKYGGPFTTEQVEDVKTVLKILVYTIPIWLLLTSFYMYSNTMTLLKADPVIVYGNTTYTCLSNTLQYFTYDSFLIATAVLLMYEFMLYPLIWKYTISSIHRKVLTSILIVLANIYGTALCIYYQIDPNIHPVFAYVHSLSVGLIVAVLLTASVEFITAQSPHNTRAMLLGYIWCINTLTFALGQAILFTLKELSNQALVLVHAVVATVMGLLGLVLLCVLAMWYKGRVRDDIVTPHRWVEEAYVKYIETERTQRKINKQ